MSELIAKYKGGSYKPLMDIKGSYLLKKHKIPLQKKLKTIMVKKLYEIFLLV